jgi:hypothetical protein
MKTERRKHRKESQLTAEQDQEARKMAKEIAQAFATRMNLESTLISRIADLADNTARSVSSLDHYVQALDTRLRHVQEIQKLLDRGKEQMRLSAFDTMYTPASVLLRRMYSAYAAQIHIIRSLVPAGGLAIKLFDIRHTYALRDRSFDFELGYAAALEEFIELLDKDWIEKGRTHEHSSGGGPNH